VCSLTPAVFQEALSTQTGMIISYHPPIFRPLSALTLANPLQSSLLNCAAAGISVYSPHTALDCVKGGVNDWLAGGVLGGTSGEVSILGEEKEGGAGVGRLVSLAQREGIDSLAQRIKQFLKLDRGESPPASSNEVSAEGGPY
jgi:putative NIF3 family GTP cyclohydrolase 1 type 2